MRSLHASPLANVVAGDALALTLLALAHALSAPLSRLLQGDGSHAVGLLLVGAGWLTLRRAPAWGVGARRLVARVAGALVTLYGAVLGAGPAVLAAVEARWGLAPCAREAVLALVLWAAATWLRATSPALRR